MKRLQLIGLATLALGAADAWACRCSLENTTTSPALVKTAFENATFVAEVEIVSTATVTETRRVSGQRLSEIDGKQHEETELYPLQVYVSQLNILKLWKGAATVNAVESGYHGNTCGNMQFRAGEKWLLYANRTEVADRVSTWHCMRTRPLGDAGEDIDIIDKGSAMNTKPTSFNMPVPELPVADVERAQAHYRDTFGFQVAWIQPGKEIGAVNRDNTAIFFRKRTAPFEPAVHWVYAPEIDTTFDEMKAAGARIVEPLETKPWGLRQFTVEDLDRNRFYFHCD
jgi:uncharacterized glyoxalase superfamily protein PhnB